MEFFLMRDLDYNLYILSCLAEHKRAEHSPQVRRNRTEACYSHTRSKSKVLNGSSVQYMKYISMKLSKKRLTVKMLVVPKHCLVERLEGK